MLGGCLGPIESFIHPILVYLLLPVGQSLGPLLALRSGQFDREDRLGPELAQAPEEAAGLTIGVVQHFPAGQVFLSQRLQNDQGVIPIPCLQGHSGLVQHLLELVDQATHVPLSLRGKHIIQTMQNGPDLATDGSRVDSGGTTCCWSSP